MRTQKTLLMSSLLASGMAIVIGVNHFIGSSQPKADAYEILPGYTKHCPIYLMYEMNGEYTYMTQDQFSCGSNYVDSGYRVISGGCIECGWSEDCWDPIYVPNDSSTANPPQGPPPPPEDGGDGSGDGGSSDGGSGDGGSGDGGSGDDGYEDPYDPGYDDPAMDPYEDPYNDPSYDPYMTSVDRKVKSKLDQFSGRHYVVSIQQDYVPARFGDQGDSRSDRGKLKLKSRYIAHTQDSDFVAMVKLTDGTKHYFRVFELAVDTKSAEKHFIRFGKQLSPSSITPETEVRSASLKNSSSDHTHEIALAGDREARKFVVSTVKPVSVK